MQFQEKREIYNLKMKKYNYKNTENKTKIWNNEKNETEMS